VNARDLTIKLLGELLYVERRLADDVLPTLIEAVDDDELEASLARHLEETRTHVERIETAFRRLSAAPTSNRRAAFESAVAQHDSAAPSIGDARLEDVFHAQTALHTELAEIASYRTLLHLLPEETAEVLRPSLADEERTAKVLEQTIARLVDAG
jgi:ferritin-like metal-binding protein YciE